MTRILVFLCLIHPLWASNLGQCVDLSGENAVDSWAMVTGGSEYEDQFAYIDSKTASYHVQDQGFRTNKAMSMMLEPIMKKYKTETRDDIAWIVWNDNQGEVNVGSGNKRRTSNGRQTSHSKGVLLITNEGKGFLMTHSIPTFLGPWFGNQVARKRTLKNSKQSGWENAQHVYCISIDATNFGQVTKFINALHVNVENSPTKGKSFYIPTQKTSTWTKEFSGALSTLSDIVNLKSPAPIKQLDITIRGKEHHWFQMGKQEPTPDFEKRIKESCKSQIAFFTGFDRGPDEFLGVYKKYNNLNLGIGTGGVFNEKKSMSLRGQKCAIKPGSDHSKLIFTNNGATGVKDMNRDHSHGAHGAAWMFPKSRMATIWNDEMYERSFGLYRSAFARFFAFQVYMHQRQQMELYQRLSQNLPQYLRPAMLRATQPQQQFAQHAITVRGWNPNQLLPILFPNWTPNYAQMRNRADVQLSGISKFGAGVRALRMLR